MRAAVRATVREEVAKGVVVTGEETKKMVTKVGAETKKIVTKEATVDM